MSQLQNDGTLIQRVRGGDREAFGALYRLHQHRVRAIVIRYAQGDDADDLMQMVFMKAFRGLDHFRGASAFSTWLTRIAINVCTTHLRSLRTRRNAQANLELQLCDPVGATPEDVTLRKERRQMVTRGIRSLPETHRRVLWLRYMKELSYQEIGETLQVPLGTVKIWLYRGRHQLKCALEQMGDMAM